jgi:NADH-ubiquinone oxidoreductase chain 6
MITLPLHLINETYTFGFEPSILDFFSIFAIICGILVIINKNPIIAVLFLIGLFGNISAYLLALGLGFIGLAYLIVYIGAVSILFLFILMLINIRISELQSNTSNSIILAMIIGISYNHPLFKILPENNEVINTLEGDVNSFGDGMFNVHRINNLEYATSRIWDANVMEHSHITSLGNIMYSSYSI